MELQSEKMSKVSEEKERDLAGQIFKLKDQLDTSNAQVSKLSTNLE